MTLDEQARHREAPTSAPRLTAGRLSRRLRDCPLRRCTHPSEPFKRAQLFWLLRNPIYAGLIAHKDKLYPGQHSRLIEEPLWDAVQQQLDANRQGVQEGPTQCRVSPLAGRVFAPDGEPLTATHATKGKVRYRYYVSRHLAGPLTARISDPMELRIPAMELESALIAALADRIADPFRLIQESRFDDLLSAVDAKLLARANEVSSMLKAKRSEGQAMLRAAVVEAVIHPDSVLLRIRPLALLAMLGIALPVSEPAAARLHSITVACRVQRSGKAVRFITYDGRPAAPSPAPDSSALQAIARGRAWWAALCAEPDLKVITLAQREAVDPGLMGRILKLAFLDPRIVNPLVQGAAPASLNLRKLTRDDIITPRWSDQREALGMVPQG